MRASRPRPSPPNVESVFGRAYLERLRRKHPNPYRRGGVATWLLDEGERVAALDRWLDSARRLGLLDRDAMRRLKSGRLDLFLPKVLEFAALHHFESRLGLETRRAADADFEVEAPGGKAVAVEVKTPGRADLASFASALRRAAKAAKRPTWVVLASTAIASGFAATYAEGAVSLARPGTRVAAVAVLGIVARTGQTRLAFARPPHAVDDAERSGVPPPNSGRRAPDNLG